MKKLFIVFLALLMATIFCGVVAAEETRSFTDDLGRTVQIPVTINHISPSGSLAEMNLYCFGADKFATIYFKLTDGMKNYLDPRLFDLPVTGSMFGAKTTMNAEEIISLKKKIGIDVIIDVGEPKAKVGSEMDDMQGKTGVPFVFITQNTLDDISPSFIKLGELLGEKDKGDELAKYTSGIVQMYKDNMAKIGDKKVSMIYVTKVDGNAVNLIGNGSYFAEIIDGLANNIAPTAKTGSGSGDQYTMEDIMRMNPDYIIVKGSEYLQHDYYNEIMTSDMWKVLPAVKLGHVYEEPVSCPHNWVGSPSVSNRLISILWLGNLFYPETFNYNVDEKIIEFYDKFYNDKLSQDELNKIMVHSKGTASSATKSPMPVLGIIAGLAAAGFVVLRRRLN